MNESDTPRTDEAIEAMGLAALVVPVEVCRQLERELNTSEIWKKRAEIAEAEVARMRRLYWRQ